MENEMEKPIEMFLCEIPHLCLHPDTLYIFRRDPKCKECENYLDPGIKENNNKSNNIVFWDYPEEECLRYTDEDEAIECLIDEMELPYPETITIAGYARMELGDLSYHDVLSNLLESIDESYGNPEEMTEPTPAMKEAEKAFLAVIEKEYFVWTCKEVCRKKINVAEWIKENRPDLIEEKKEE